MSDRWVSIWLGDVRLRTACIMRSVSHGIYGGIINGIYEGVITGIFGGIMNGN